MQQITDILEHNCCEHLYNIVKDKYYMDYRYGHSAPQECVEPPYLHEYEYVRVNGQKTLQVLPGIRGRSGGSAIQDCQQSWAQTKSAWTANRIVDHYDWRLKTRLFAATGNLQQMPRYAPNVRAVQSHGCCARVSWDWCAGDI